MSWFWRKLSKTEKLKQELAAVQDRLKDKDLTWLEKLAFERRVKEIQREILEQCQSPR